MKKLVLTIAIVLGMTFGASAQYFGNSQPQGGGLFGRGETPDYGNDRTANNLPLLPNHGETGNQDAPLGSGALLLIGFGAAYAMAKKNRKE
ncbi:MAG: hypothetical protein MJZ91_00145 [Bacteroidales bacterium]|nr:hypothetical protein [Bacteroidales bacterium]